MLHTFSGLGIRIQASRKTMEKRLLLLSIVFAIQTLSFGQQSSKIIDDKNAFVFERSRIRSAKGEVSGLNNAIRVIGLELPETNQSDIITTHKGYSLLYNEKYEQASWVAYELTKEETDKINNRTDKFIVDPQVTTETANKSDYVGSGYDSGHLAPAADMSWSSTAMAESFYYSNMSPQEPGFNRGIWKKLEEQVRTWAVDNQSVYVITGPVLTSGLLTIGNNKVSVPKYYYKVILDYTEPEIKGIGFILPNTGSSEPLQVCSDH